MHVHFKIIPQHVRDVSVYAQCINAHKHIKLFTLEKIGEYQMAISDLEREYQISTDPPIGKGEQMKLLGHADGFHELHS